MLKLLAITLLLSSFAEASKQSKVVQKFVKESLKDNPNIKSLKVNVSNEVKLQKPKGWNGYLVDINAVLTKGDRNVNQKTIWFSDGKVITSELIDIETGDSLKALVSPEFKTEYYKDSHLIYGNKNAKNKIVIFSDPLCPFCKNFVPQAINYMKTKPNKFAVYYYHFPLPSLHPAAVELSKAAIALELKAKRKDIVLDMYKIKLDPKERNVQKILQIFNEHMHSNITISDISSQAVLNEYNSDLARADSVMVQGTPTMFFNGKLDKSKNKYKEVN